MQKGQEITISDQSHIGGIIMTQLVLKDNGVGVERSELLKAVADATYEYSGNLGDACLIEAVLDSMSRDLIYKQVGDNFYIKLKPSVEKSYLKISGSE